MTERPQVQLEANQMFEDSEIDVVKSTINAMCLFLEESDIRFDDGIPTEWLAHIVLMEGMCDCDLETDYDGAYDNRYCAWYRKEENRLAWFCYWHDTTPEALAEWLQAEKAYDAERLQQQLGRERELRLDRLYELGGEFGIDRDKLKGLLP